MKTKEPDSILLEEVEEDSDLDELGDDGLDGYEEDEKNKEDGGWDEDEEYDLEI